MRFSPLLAFVMAVTASVLPAGAGPADTPLPTFSDGKPAVSVYLASGVVKNNNLETLFICTNLSAVAVDVGVEVFDETGVLRNDVNAGNGALLDVAPGRSETITTGATVVFHEDADITLNNAGSGANNLRNGSGRIVATSGNLSCNAMLVDKLHAVQDPAVFPNAAAPTVVNLPLVRTP